MTELLLASTSPRRRALLEQLGLRFTVVAVEVDERPLPDEQATALVARLSRLKACAGAATLAREDAHAPRVPRLSPAGADVRGGGGGAALVIAADTVVVLDGRVLGKPRDEEQNRAFLRLLAGRTHEVLTGHTLRLVTDQAADNGGAGQGADHGSRGPGAGQSGLGRVADHGGPGSAGANAEGLSVVTTVVTTSVCMRELGDDAIARYVASGEGLDKAGGYAVQGRGAALVRGVRGSYSNVVGLSLGELVEDAMRLGVTLA